MKKIQFDPVDWNYQEKAEWYSPIHQSQSPIDIVKKNLQSLQKDGNIDLNYQNELDAVIDTGYCVQCYAKGIAVINNQPYHLQQFHFHSPGEHKIDGKSFPIELHFLHQSPNGGLAVIAVLFEIGKKNDQFDFILDNLDKLNFDSRFKLSGLLPEKFDYYHYLGSLTTPPLSENVQWYIFSNPMTVTKRQLDRLRLIHKNNFRDVQPLNNRPIFKKTFR